LAGCVLEGYYGVWNAHACMYVEAKKNKLKLSNAEEAKSKVFSVRRGKILICGIYLN